MDAGSNSLVERTFRTLSRKHEKGYEGTHVMQVIQPSCQPGICRMCYHSQNLLWKATEPR